MTIGVFFGGKNTEHDVSIITGQLIIAGLKELGHTVVPIYISKEGKWFIDERMDNIEFFKKLNAQTGLKNLNNFVLNLAETEDGSTTVKTTGLIAKNFKLDLAFPAFHGLNGEDGTIQGFFELLNIPYVGCDLTASALSIDKVLTKLLYQKFNIPTAKFTYFTTKQWNESKEAILEDLTKNYTWPLIVKPSRLGSSIGIAKAESNDDLEYGIEVALHYDDKVVVEECVQNLMDLTIAVLGNDEPKASLIQESSFTKDIFSYEDKYLEEGGAQLGNAEKKIIIPASLDQQTTKELQDLACKIYQIFGCSGMARVDFLYDRIAKRYYANEINTLPGTLYHHLWKKSGVELSALLTQLVELAQERFQKKQKLTYTFDSAILNQANNAKMKLKGV